jgi:hypothetical protein
MGFRTNNLIVTLQRMMTGLSRAMAKSDAYTLELYPALILPLG